MTLADLKAELRELGYTDLDSEAGLVLAVQTAHDVGEVEARKIIGWYIDETGDRIGA